MSDSPNHHGGGMPEPAEWIAPKSENDIRGMIRIQQQSFRLANAFPTHSSLGNEEQFALIEELPPVGEPGSLEQRFEIFARGHMLSLDLDRIENEGDWQVGADLDASLEAFLGELSANDGLQRELGVIALGGVIPKDSPEAKPRSHATDLGPELSRNGVFLVTRQRRVARFAIRNTGDVFVVRKRSDFELRAHPERDEMLYLRAAAVARGGPGLDFGVAYGYTIEQMSEMNSQLRTGFNADIEQAILRRDPRLRPHGMGYHVALRERQE